MTIGTSIICGSLLLRFMVYLTCHRDSCHSEQAFFAPRGIWASRAKRRVLCDAITACLARFLIKLGHYLSPDLPHSAPNCLLHSRGELKVVRVLLDLRSSTLVFDSSIFDRQSTTYADW